MPPSTSPADARTLDAMGLRHGEAVRFKRREGRRWQPGRIVRVECDGSITLRDSDGAARSLRPDALEVRRPGGSRGRLVWRSVGEVALTWEQLELFPGAGTATFG